jgi:hypothetical protein
MHMRCQSLADRTSLLAQEEILLDQTAPVRVLPAYLHNLSQGCRSRSASTPSASDWFARGPLLCIRTRLQKRAESATGRTLSLASADVLVQIRSDLCLRFATFPPARRTITVLPLPQRPRSVHIRAVPFVVFSSTASDVLHIRPCCSRANSPTTVALQLLPHRACSPCTPLQHPPDGVLNP